MDDVLAVLDHEEDLVLPAELVADLFDAFEGNFAVGLAVFSLEDVAWVGRAVPKQPEPMTRLML